MNKIKCPKCKSLEKINAIECSKCGLVFTKHMDFTPIKVKTDKITNSDIAEIKNIKEDLKRDKKNKIKILAECKKSKLLDLAAHYLRKPKDQLLIKTLNSINYLKLKDRIKFKISPLFLISSIFFIILAIFVIWLRSLL